MNPLYCAGIWTYRQGVRLAAVRSGKARLLDRGLGGVFARLKAKTDPYGRYVWIHAASLGEFEQARPLIERIRRERPELKVILTFFSPSGYEVRKNYDKADIVSYLPFDTPRNVRRFLDIVNPVAAIFVKYEFWPNYLEALHRREIPTYLISGIFRHGQLFFRPYGGWYRKCLRCFDRLYLQDKGSKALLAGIGIKNVTVAGDTRFDRVTDIVDAAKKIPVIEHFIGHGGDSQDTDTDTGTDAPVFMAGSSWPADEKIYAGWALRHIRDIRTIIAPHEFDKRRLDALTDLFGRDNTLLMSETEGMTPAEIADRRVLIIDCFGLLSSAYAYADIAYVGGGFGAGLHNINEAAVYGIPVVYGPNHSKFIEAEEMKTLGAGIAVGSRESFEKAADRLIADQAERIRRGRWAADYIRRKTGATDIIFGELFGQGARAQR